MVKLRSVTIQLWSISANTFLQTLRQPVFTVVVLVTFGVLVFSLPFTGYTLSVDYHQSDQQMLENTGLGTLRVAGLLMAAFCASGVLRREIEEKTALIVIAKPVPRWTFVLGKFFGVAAAIAVAYYLCSLVFLMTVRHRVTPARSDPIDWPVIVIGVSAFLLAMIVAMVGNFWFGWAFTSSNVLTSLLFLSLGMVAIGFVGKGWRIVPFGQGISAQLLVELAMMFMAVVVFVALAVAASTRLGQAMTLLVCALVFVLGSAHPYLVALWGDRVPAARVLGWVLPNFSQFYPQDDLRLAGTIPLSLVALAGLYCLLYTGGLLAVGAALFETRELEATASTGATPALVNLLAWTGQVAAAAAVLGATVLVSLKEYGLGRFGISLGLLAAAGIAFLVWRAFGTGRRWSYWAVLAASALTVTAGAVMLVVPPRLTGRQVAAPVLIATAAVVAAAVLLVLLLPKTRRHFHFRAR